MNMLVQLWLEFFFFFNGPVLAEIFRPASYNFNMILAWEIYKKIHNKQLFCLYNKRDTDDDISLSLA